MLKLRCIGGAAILLALAASATAAAQAKPRQVDTLAQRQAICPRPIYGFMGVVWCAKSASALRRKAARRYHHARVLRTSIVRASRRFERKSISTTIGLAAAPAKDARIVAHPVGCPSRAFCGCGAALRIFGQGVRRLWLAANWLAFPRAAPAPGMAAVRRHHVMVLEAHVGGSAWVVYDANSGGHKTRIHVRSIAGYAIVNPRGGSA